MLLQTFSRCNRNAWCILCLIYYKWLSILWYCTPKCFSWLLLLLWLLCCYLSFTLLERFNKLCTLGFLYNLLLQVFLLTVCKLDLRKFNLLRSTSSSCWIWYTLAYLAWIELVLIRCSLIFNLDLSNQKLWWIRMTKCIFMVYSRR